MTVYFHHVGEVGAERDFPRTIFDEGEVSGLRHFKEQDILPQVSDLPEEEIFRIAATIRRAPDGFQIWGIPSGGSRLFRRVSENDFWLLIDTDRPGGTISYGGRIICKFENPSFHLSNFLWGELKFPLIIFMDGFRTDVEITTFKQMFGYADNWLLCYRLNRLCYRRRARSCYTSEPRAGSEANRQIQGSFADFCLLRVRL